MNRSDRISKEHEDRLAKLPHEQRKKVLGETTRLLKRLRVVTRFEQMFGCKPTAIHISDDDLVDWLKSRPMGSRITPCANMTWDTYLRSIRVER